MSEPSPPEPVVEKSSSNRTLAIGILGAIAIVFALLNSQSVKMHWIVTTTKTPLIIMLVLFGLIGAGVGYIYGRRSTKEQ